MTEEIETLRWEFCHQVYKGSSTHTLLCFFVLWQWLRWIWLCPRLIQEGTHHIPSTSWEFFLPIISSAGSFSLAFKQYDIFVNLKLYLLAPSVTKTFLSLYIQSGFKPYHPTKAVPVEVTNDLPRSTWILPLGLIFLGSSSSAHLLNISVPQGSPQPSSHIPYTFSG